jgi:Peptidase_C39 like family
MPPFVTNRLSHPPVVPPGGVGRPAPGVASGTVVAPRTPTVVARPDPLAVTAANGTSFDPVDRSALNEKMREALALGSDVPGRVQDGPTCGLYALGMVMDYWDKRDSKNKNPLVQDGDAVRWDSHSIAPDTNQRLFDVAKGKGFTTQGEMFYADHMATLARHFGYQASVKSEMTLEDIKACIDRDHPALVGFDVDNNGNPGLFGGKRAHWAVIEGYFQKDGVDFLVATHGWTGKEYVWKAADFMASVNQLDKSDFPAAPRDITQTLKGRLVEVSPGVPSGG